MTERIFRSINEPLRGDLSYNDRWQGPDQGLITCWETGRKLAIKDPELAEKALRDELPVLDWKGGIDKPPKNEEKTPKKYGSMYYLAQWQGLRGDDLDIDLSQEPVLICSKIGLRTTFTLDVNKHSNT